MIRQLKQTAMKEERIPMVLGHYVELRQNQPRSGGILVAPGGVKRNPG